LQGAIRSSLEYLKNADEQFTIIIKSLNQLKTNFQVPNAAWTTKSLNWSKLTRKTLQQIHQGTVQDIVEQISSKNFIPANKTQIAYIQVQQTLWALKSRHLVTKNWY
jgi:hypothetical protein